MAGAIAYLVRASGKGCTSPARSLNLQSDMDLPSCADACAADPKCNFFIFGTGHKKGRCFAQYTASADCPEGFEADSYDFYEVCPAGAKGCTKGCTDRAAPNYNPLATMEDGSCQEADACVSHTDSGACAVPPAPYRNKQNDTIFAVHVSDDAVTIDGDLRDWSTHPLANCYSNLGFANASGAEVVFESQDGGKWYGPKDFEVSGMMAWDSSRLLLALDVVDDRFQVGPTCYQQGVQVGFEVVGPRGGPGRPRQGTLQGERSDQLGISRLRLINVGLAQGQSSCSQQDRNSSRHCCVHHEKDNGGADSWMQLTDVAVLRNHNSRRTTFEIAFDIRDLLGSNSDSLSRWKEGLRFGMSWLVNDGDDQAAQQGWAGFYPHGLVLNWNGGQKSPSKVGLVELIEPPVARGGFHAATHGQRTGVTSSGGGVSSGGAAGLFFLGMAVGPLLIVIVVYSYRAYQKGSCPSSCPTFPSSLPSVGSSSRGGSGGTAGLAPPLVSENPYRPQLA